MSVGRDARNGAAGRHAVRVPGINYHHLLYFWAVVREGTVTAAAARLRLATPTVSAQVRLLEDQLGEKLLRRAGRGLELTEAGRVTYRYADEIFTLGRELEETLRSPTSGRRATLVVGVLDVLPKMIVRPLLQPALVGAERIKLVCREGKTEALVAALSLHEIDVVLSDAPLPPGAAVRAHAHLLGKCGVTFVAATRLAHSFRRGFPASLDGAPLLMPTEGTTLRRALEHWLADEGIRPVVVAEIEDSALLKAIGQDGLGIFVVPRVVESAVKRQYDVEVVGRTDRVEERFFALTMRRRVEHPGVAAILSAARSDLFG